MGPRIYSFLESQIWCARPFFRKNKLDEKKEIVYEFLEEMEKIKISWNN